MGLTPGNAAHICRNTLSREDSDSFQLWTGHSFRCQSSAKHSAQLYRPLQWTVTGRKHLQAGWKSRTLYSRTKTLAVWVSVYGLMSYSTHNRSFRGRFLQARWPNQQRQSTEGNQLVVKDQAWIPPEPLHRVTIIHLNSQTTSIIVTDCKLLRCRDCFKLINDSQYY